ncbi:hypothetical protein RDWZM_001253 [Blomia tropicalis]|uniref:BTB domain-containing protein n=1 Tax=Blomia tropicalis TaxID=40697 RepID=A0A9Q0MAB8_BLOTA|nr:hypothetical protein RDWZM_001253 [Blomia tropicalis]
MSRENTPVPSTDLMMSKTNSVQSGTPMTLVPAAVHEEYYQSPVILYDKRSTISISYNWRITHSDYLRWFEHLNPQRSWYFGNDAIKLRLHLSFDNNTQNECISLERCRNLKKDGKMGVSESESIPDELILNSYSLNSYTNSHASDKAIKIGLGKKVTLWTTNHVFSEFDTVRDKTIRCEFKFTRVIQNQADRQPKNVQNSKLSYEISNELSGDPCQSHLDTTENIGVDDNYDWLAPPPYKPLVEPVNHSQNESVSDVSTVSDVTSMNVFKADSTKTSSISERTQNRMKMLRKNGKYSDMFFEVSEVEIPAHKCMLSNASAVFDSLMGKLEPNQKLAIDDLTIEPDAVSAMLDYLYFGSDSETIQRYASQMFKLAKKFDLVDLIEECERYLKEDITVESVCKVLLTSHENGFDDLKQKAIEFININSSEVMATDGWKEMILGNASLLAQLYAARVSTS